MRCMCHQGVTTKQRALRAVLTRTACACRGLRRVILVDVICVMLVVLIPHVDVVHAVYVKFSKLFSVVGDVLFTHPCR